MTTLQISKTLHFYTTKSPLGSLLIVADEEAVYFAEYLDRPELKKEIERLKLKTGAKIQPGKTAVAAAIEEEIALYFKGEIQQFKTPIALLGTPFQNQVWGALLQIPYGQTRSYQEIAVQIGKPTGYRAVAQANGANHLPIIIPCHRVINANGGLGGYSGTLERKTWLLHHENQN